MAKNSRPMGKKKNGTKLKIMVEKLQKSFLPGKRSSANNFDQFEDSQNVPNNVKEGHFAVMVVDDDDKLKKFIVPLSCLTHPSFLRLLEQAAEEYGFDHEGAVMVPCRPSELEKILVEQWVEESGSKLNWRSCTSQELLFGI